MRISRKKSDSPLSAIFYNSSTLKFDLSKPGRLSSRRLSFKGTSLRRSSNLARSPMRSKRLQRVIGEISSHVKVWRVMGTVKTPNAAQSFKVPTSPTDFAVPSPDRSTHKVVVLRHVLTN